jgi:UDP-4-amino-4,6-dideoxy-N-acetyl-beta-L-altrosamine N-acetyltransferase
MAKGIALRPLTSIDRDAQLSILKIRNEEGVRKWMYTDHVIPEPEHFAWIERLKNDARQIVFAVIGDEPLGVVSVNAIDRLQKRTDWAYYLTASSRGGLGSAIEFAFIEYVFDGLGMEKLNCEVIEGNDPVVKLHKKFLFVEEGFRRSNVVKNGSRLGAHFLGLTKEDWLAGRDGVKERYGVVLDKFTVIVN